MDNSAEPNGISAATAKWRSRLDLGVTVTMVLTCLAILVHLYAPDWVAMRSGAMAAAPAHADEPLPTAPISLDGSALLGSQSAPAVIVEYSDFQCPFCRKFAQDVMPSVKSKYVDTGKVQFAFEEAPIVAMHPFALRAAVAAQCAGSQGRFWQMHDALFATPRFEDGTFHTLARQSLLDMREFDSCFSGEASANIQRRELEHGKALSLRGTPTFLVGLRQRDGLVKITGRLTGVQTLDQFGAAIQTALEGAAVATAATKR